MFFTQFGLSPPAVKHSRQLTTASSEFLGRGDGDDFAKEFSENDGSDSGRSLHGR
jgi:hypothetical protein